MLSALFKMIYLNVYQIHCGLCGTTKVKSYYISDEVYNLSNNKRSLYMQTKESFYRPYSAEEVISPYCPSQRRIFENTYDYIGEYEEFYDFEDYNLYYRASQQDITRIFNLLSEEEPELFRNFTRFGVPRQQVNNYFRIAINYTLDNTSKSSGNINQRTSAIFNDFRREYANILNALRRQGVRNNIINNTFRDVIEFTLRNTTTVPAPPQPPQSRWSQWEDLGGVLTSGPAVASWTPNRLDAFAAGANNNLYHKYWDGSRWSNWENLGGTLTSSPAAVSWGNNRIDVFVRGTTNTMYHKYWDGSRWSDWEDLGGILSSSPAASSWGDNRIDTFVRGTDNALYHKYWNGSSWSEWENLGGNLTSSPAAVSWGNNRIDVFARGQGDNLYHKWWDGSRWSDWENLGGNLTSDPAVSSRASNRLEVFARGRNNVLMTKIWDGSRWSDWENLGGTLTSHPAAVSWGPNRTDVFARGTNNAMWHIWRD